jgi:hypothetical protein
VIDMNDLMEAVDLAHIDETTDAEQCRSNQILDDLLRRTAASRLHPFTAIDWTAPEHRIDPQDPRWLSCLVGPPAPADWFATLSAPQQATFAMERACVFFLAGIEFETGLSTGLLQFAQRPGTDRRTFAYIYEEIIEEAQHSLMFRTFVERCSPELIDLAGQATDMAKIGARVADFATRSPLLFLAGVLCGEEPIDHEQRSFLRLPAERRHPLVSAVCSLHVDEEARHLRFARSQFRELLANSPQREVDRVRRLMPPLTQQMTAHMLDIPVWFARRWGIPAEQLESDAWRKASQDHQFQASSKLRALGRHCGMAV